MKKIVALSALCVLLAGCSLVRDYTPCGWLYGKVAGSPTPVASTPVPLPPPPAQLEK